MHPRPDVIVFDVNETLSDMAPLARRFADIATPDLQAPDLVSLAGQIIA